MSEFIGRTGALRVYSYPEPRRAGSASLFARNFASGPVGPSTPVDIATDPGTQVPWDAIESGAPAGDDVPITPLSTGIILITGVVTVKTSSDTPVSVDLDVQLNDASLVIPNLEAQTIVEDGFATIPFVAKTTAAQTPVGVLANIQIRLIASVGGGVIQLRPRSSTISLQEVSVATG